MIGLASFFISIPAILLLCMSFDSSTPCGEEREREREGGRG